MTAFLSNAFNDPSNPWYYVLGVFFLLIIFGALAFYIVWDGKRKKRKSEENQENSNNEPPVEKSASDTDNVLNTDVEDNADTEERSENQ